MNFDTEEQHVTLKMIPSTGAGARLLVTVALAAFAVTAFGDARADVKPVDADLAAVAAQHHLQRFDPTGKFSLGAARPILDSEGVALAYRFDLWPYGRVIASASTALPPIIAYSFNESAEADNADFNPLEDMLRADLRSRLDHLAALSAEVLRQRAAAWSQLAEHPELGPDGPDMEQWPPAGSTTTGGWVITRWNQSAPYNNLCPMDSVTGLRSIAGCPAVAMAQIVNYHKRLNGTRFDDADDYRHNYQGRTYWIDNDYAAYEFPSFPQLNAYLGALLDQYFYGSAPNAANRGALIFACGVAARQVYTSGAAGTFGVDQALAAYRKFHCDTAELLYEYSPGPYERLSANMKEGYPAHLAVVTTTGSSGHNLVVDGYNTEDYYHLNFGWGGAYDSWYLLPSEMPYNLTIVEGIIVDIMIDGCGLMDFTCDGTVSWDDFTYMAQCIAGPAGSPEAPGCAAFDANGDEDVDLADFATFQLLYELSAE